MRSRRWAAAAVLFLAPWACVGTACSSDSSGKHQGPGKDGAAAGPRQGGASGSGANGSGATENTGGLILGVGANGGSVGQMPDGTSCARVVRKGETVPLDMYILLDKSSSMLDTTGAGPT